MRYFVILLLACFLPLSSARAEDVVADLAVDSFMACVNCNIQFNGGGSGPIDTIYWDWNNDGTWDEWGPIGSYGYRLHSWSTGGEKYIKMKVADTVPPETSEDTITAGPFYIGQPIIVASTTFGRSPLYVAFDGTNSLPTSMTRTYEWDFSYDGQQFNQEATGGTTSYTFTATSTVALRVTYDGAMVCLTTAVITIT